MNTRNKNSHYVRETIGSALGISGSTYQRLKAVAEASRHDPETYGSIAEEMDQTGNVYGAYKKVMEIKKRKRSCDRGSEECDPAIEQPSAAARQTEGEDQ